MAKEKAAPAGGEAQYSVIKLRLYPTGEQAALLDKTFGCCRYLWNRMLADVQEFYAAADVHYIPAPARYKREAPFLTEVDSQALCAVHQNLRRAFADFFRAPEAFGYPRFKSKRAGKESFTVYCRPYRTGPSIVLTENGVRMPKLGLLRARVHRWPASGWSLRSATVRKSASGKYYCALSFKLDGVRPPSLTPAPARTVGLSHSARFLYVDSSGARCEMPPWLEKSKAKLARLQSRRSRMRRGSHNYEKMTQRIRLLQEHAANQRRDFIHKESRRTADAWDAVCVRDTDLKQLARQGANVLANGFGMLRECLKYKLARQGKPCILVGRYAPTSRVCHACGHINENLTARERRWVCPRCGAALSREENAARNIRDWGLAQYLETSVSNAVS